MRRRTALTALGGLGGLGLAGATAAILPGQARAADEVQFQNRGSVEGWDHAYTQKDGVIETVDSPTYKGAHALAATQTYIDETGGYRTLAQCSILQGGGEGHPVHCGPEGHSGMAKIASSDDEVVGSTAGRAGSDACGGPCKTELPGDRQGPVKQEPKVVPRRGTDRNLLPSGKRGRQHSEVIRRGAQSVGRGVFEVWLNGTRTVSRTGITVLPSTSRTIRWSNGIYCTAWREGKPSGPRTLTILHDSHRIASTYALAEPANWS
ncbi:translation initiation factor IF-2 [Streptomyces sp. ME02-8801-2C]|uniref:translation initiation factor IF-2 n=1 Tax=Streptomyces sp. ME02-8801-2C TaxID=3028680 RepID=UPI0029AF7F40|nr:translation initiation factor IF-2 [Streptomyces sp. ME02-8801-2C]MDX3452969.1 translation initiation factor IF-2 [Streptomyces sp. ME02-8801-2C]